MLILNTLDGDIAIAKGNIHTIQEDYDVGYYYVTDCAVRPPLQERRGMSEANHSLSKCGDIRR